MNERLSFSFYWALTMSQSQQQPVSEFIDVFKALAEGRFDPETWLEWWTQNCDRVQHACLPGWYLRLKPKTTDRGVLRTALGSQAGACYILDALNVPYERSARYQLGWEEEFRRFRETEDARKAERTERYTPIVKSFGKIWPKFARLLKRQLHHIDEMREPITESELTNIETVIGPLPRVYKQFLLCSRALGMEGLIFGIEHPFVHESQAVILPTEGMVCFADYWLDADGDQVLFDLRNESSDDPPVFYYSHEGNPPCIRQIAGSFSEWLEKLPRSDVFRE